MGNEGDRCKILKEFEKELLSKLSSDCTMAEWVCAISKYYAKEDELFGSSYRERKLREKILNFALYANSEPPTTSLNIDINSVINHLGTRIADGK